MRIWGLLVPALGLGYVAASIAWVGMVNMYDDLRVVLPLQSTAVVFGAITLGIGVSRIARLSRANGALLVGFLVPILSIFIVYATAWQVSVARQSGKYASFQIFIPLYALVLLWPTLALFNTCCRRLLKLRSGSTVVPHE